MRLAHSHWSSRSRNSAIASMIASSTRTAKPKTHGFASRPNGSGAKYERLHADEESTQSDYDKLYEELSAYSDTLTTEQLMDWFIDLNDPETISGWTERIEAHNAYIDVMEPNNAVLRNPLDVDSTFHIRIYDYFIDFHEDREIVDDLEFTPSDVDADDWTEDIKRCLEENGWRLDSKIGTDSDDSDLLVFDCVKA